MSTLIQVLLIIASILAALVVLAILAALVAGRAPTPPYRRPLPPGDGDWGESIPAEGEGR